jgi:hypothetical protein
MARLHRPLELGNSIEKRPKLGNAARRVKTGNKKARISHLNADRGSAIPGLMASSLSPVFLNTHNGICSSRPSTNCVPAIIQRRRSLAVISLHGTNNGGCPIRKKNGSDIYNPLWFAPSVRIPRYEVSQRICADWNLNRCPSKSRSYRKRSASFCHPLVKAIRYAAAHHPTTRIRIAAAANPQLKEFGFPCMPEILALSLPGASTFYLNIRAPKVTYTRSSRKLLLCKQITNIITDNIKTLLLLVPSGKMPAPMTVESFYETLKSAVEIDVRLRLQASLEAIRDTLNNLVTSPAHPEQQSNLASALKNFTTAAEELGKTLTPSQIASLADAGGAEYFDPSIADKVKTSVSTNAMTPSVARDYVQDLANRRARYLTTVEQTLSGLDKLGVSGQELAPGDSDMAFIVPPDLFDNQVASFAKELIFINNLVQHFSEALTGAPEPVLLQSLSSSMPTITVAASARVTEGIAIAVNQFLEAWEKADKIRRIRQELIDMGLKKQTFDDLTDQITNTVDQIVEDSIQATLSNYDHDSVRKRQLEVALRQDTRRLFGQIERGLAIHFRARPRADAPQLEKIALETIDSMCREMHFPQKAAEPMLLTRSQVLEGDVDTTSVPKKAPAPQPPTNGTHSNQPAPLAAAGVSSGSSSSGSSGGGLWSRRRGSDRQD